MTKPMTISELRRRAKYFRCEGYTLEFWANGTWFIEAPSGEGTEVPEEAVAGVLAQLFNKFF